MKELDELNERLENSRDFQERGARVVAVSLDGRADAAKTQKKFPNLLIVADHDGDLIRNARLLDEDGYSPTGGPLAAPTTVVLDREGVVRWVFRPTRYLERPPPGKVLAAMDDLPPAGKK
jgi:peroxiredoxin